MTSITPMRYLEKIKQCLSHSAYRKDYAKLTAQHGLILYYYDYVICRKKQFIFVHVPKTAGKSLRKALFQQQDGTLHQTIGNLVKLFPGDDCHYFKFCFVRNPWDRVLSAYHYLARGGNGGQRDLNFLKTHLAAVNSFAAFVKNWLSTENIWQQLHLYPQCYFLNNDLNAVDFIGRYENLAQDFEVVCQRLAIQYRLPHVNASKQGVGSYRDYYDEEMQQKIAHLYQADIKAFNYEF